MKSLARLAFASASIERYASASAIELELSDRVVEARSSDESPVGAGGPDTGESGQTAKDGSCSVGADQSHGPPLKATERIAKRRAHDPKDPDGSRCPGRQGVLGDLSVVNVAAVQHD